MSDWVVDAVEQPQLWEIVYARIRDAILDGTLAPGSRLVERDLAARFGTSRGPIRDAIRELARQGLVADLPRRGTVVSTPTARDLSEAYLVREALEYGACRTVVEIAADAEIGALEQHLAAFEAAWTSGAAYIDAAQHDLAFHRALVGLTRNSRMIAVYEQMLGTTMLLLRAAAETSPRLRTGMEPWVHRDIVAALRERTASRAREAVEAHYRVASERLFAADLAPEPTERP
ncbi:MAG: GntR family transcriptional regulator [Gaiellales bacterium]